MSDLDILRPEVREAVREIVLVAAASRTDLQHSSATIRAELLRLEGECGRLDRDWQCAVNQALENGQRAERAEAELAAVKARMEGGIDMGCPVECFVGSRRGRILNPFTPPAWIGKRVRLVVEE